MNRKHSYTVSQMIKSNDVAKISLKQMYDAPFISLVPQFRYPEEGQKVEICSRFTLLA